MVVIFPSFVHHDDVKIPAKHVWLPVHSYAVPTESIVNHSDVSIGYRIMTKRK
jgi:hypothetical protein